MVKKCHITLFSVNYWTGRKSNLCHYYLLPSRGLNLLRIWGTAKMIHYGHHWYVLCLSQWSPFEAADPVHSVMTWSWTSLLKLFYLRRKVQVAGSSFSFQMRTKPFLSSQFLFHHPHNIIPSRSSQFLENKVKKKIFGLLEQKSPKGIALFLEGNWRQKSNLRIKHDLISQRIIPLHCVLYLFFLYILLVFLSVIKTDDIF